MHSAFLRFIRVILTPIVMLGIMVGFTSAASADTSKSKEMLGRMSVTNVTCANGVADYEFRVDTRGLSGVEIPVYVRDATQQWVEADEDGNAYIYPPDNAVTLFPMSTAIKPGYNIGFMAQGWGVDGMQVLPVNCRTPAIPAQVTMTSCSVDGPVAKVVSTVEGRIFVGGTFRKQIGARGVVSVQVPKTGASVILRDYKGHRVVGRQMPACPPAPW